MTFEALNIELHGQKGQVKTTCPQCSYTREHKDDECLSVNTDLGVYKCHHCEWEGSILSKKHYTKPKDTPENLTKGVIEYFAKRGISEKTLREMKVSSRGTKLIMFKYYRNDTLINIKYRGDQKKFSLVKDAELIFYNLDLIQDTDEAIIVEGEIDALSFYEKGFGNVVSVPNGANKNLSYLDNSYTYFTNKTRIYIATDNDEKGRELRDELCRRLNKQRCLLIDFPPGIKDANEYLQKDGDFEKLIKTARPVPVSGVIYVDEVSDRMLHEFKNGKERGTTTYFQILDPHFNWKKGELTFFTGVPNHGKSEFVDELCLVKSFKEGDKWGVFAPENYPANEYYDRLIHKYVGANIDPYYEFQCTEQQYIEGMDFVREHFYYIYPDGSHGQKAINDKFEELIVKHGITGGIIDPYNQLEHNFSLRDDQYLSEFLRIEKRFAVEYNFYKLMVIHPTKLQRRENGSYPVPGIYDCAGGAMFANKGDNIISVYRPFAHKDKSDPTTEIHVQKIKKQQLVGIPGKVTFHFNRKQRRYLQEEGIHPLQMQLIQEEVF